MGEWLCTQCSDTSCTLATPRRYPHIKPMLCGPRPDGTFCTAIWFEIPDKKRDQCGDQFGEQYQTPVMNPVKAQVSKKKNPEYIYCE